MNSGASWCRSISCTEAQDLHVSSTPVHGRAPLWPIKCIQVTINTWTLTVPNNGSSPFTPISTPSSPPVSFSAHSCPFPWRSGTPFFSSFLLGINAVRKRLKNKTSKLVFHIDAGFQKWLFVERVRMFWGTHWNTPSKWTQREKMQSSRQRKRQKEAFEEEKMFTSYRSVLCVCALITTDVLHSGEYWH